MPCLSLLSCLPTQAIWTQELHPIMRRYEVSKVPGSGVNASLQGWPLPLRGRCCGRAARGWELGGFRWWRVGEPDGVVSEGRACRCLYGVDSGVLAALRGLSKAAVPRHVSHRWCSTPSWFTTA